MWMMGGGRGDQTSQNSGKSNVHTQHHAMWSVKAMDQAIISSLDLIPTQTMCVILGNLSFLSIYPLIH